MNYRSITTLNKQLRSWATQLPRDFDLIVGIPRSGMLIANVLALRLNCLYTEIDGFLEGRIFKQGFRRRSSPPPKKALKVLIVDDSLNTGEQLEIIKKRVKEANLPHAIYYGVVYVTPGKEHHVDFYYEHLALPHIMEWQLQRNSMLITTCFDIDGVLCFDPSKGEDDGGEKYETFIKTVKPLMIPKGPIGWLVTSRLEKYRSLTMSWLSEHGIRYRELIMMNFPDRKTQQATISASAFKASVYKSTSADLFIESSVNQSVDIAFLAQKDVLCMETREVISPAIKMDTSNQLENLDKILKNSEVILRMESNRISLDLDWSGQLQKAVKEILSVVPVGSTFLLVDDDNWGVFEVFAGRRILPFLERNGYYWGPPTDDANAIQELERMRDGGAKFLVIAWQNFWWVDHYKKFHEYLHSKYSCIFRSDVVIIFDLRMTAQVSR